jgi:CRISPR-associated protein (TIGR02710 family)
VSRELNNTTMKQPEILPHGLAHIVTIGTTPQGNQPDVVEALLADLRPAKPACVVVLGTPDSSDNARRLLKGLRLPAARARLALIDSPQSLDAAYRATNSEIEKLTTTDGFTADRIVLHYTAGTKVMSAGAVLAAANRGIRSLRYLFSPGPRKASTPVNTALSTVLIDRELHIAIRLMRELRFGAAHDIAARIDRTNLPVDVTGRVELVQQLALAYGEWDSFRPDQFLAIYTPLRELHAAHPDLADFAVKPRQLEALEDLAKELRDNNGYPLGLLLDMVNNAVRRLAERDTDDAVIRLHRAAELYAQRLLLIEFRIQSDDVDIRKVPPRNRTLFEAERRLDDATIKLGMRRSFDLLAILGHKVGVEYRERNELQKALNERRNLVLAHGTRAASLELALNLHAEVTRLLRLEIPDLDRRLADLQFPWLHNAAILRSLRPRSGKRRTNP